MAASLATQERPPWLVGRAPIQDTDPRTGAPFTVSAATRKLNAMRTWFTRNITAATAAVGYTTASPSETALRNLEGALHDLVYHKEWCDFLTRYLAELVTEESLEGLMENLDDVQERYEETASSVLACVTATQNILNPPANVAAPAAAAPSAAASKVATELMPDKLASDANPGQFRHWAAQFKAFYSRSKLSTSTIPEQQWYLYKCLDVELADLVRLDVSETTQIFGAVNSCFVVLEQKFEEEFPLFVRRLQYFQAMQKQGQPFSEFVTELKKLANEASVSTITPQEIVGFRLLSAVTDAFLKEKFLELENPTFDDILKEAAKWSGVRKGMETLKAGSAPGGVVAAQQQKNKPQRKKGRGKGQGQGQGKPCGSCSGQQHPQGVECPAKHVTCNICNRTGHYARTRNGKILCRSKEGQDLAARERVALLDGLHGQPPVQAQPGPQQPAITYQGDSSQGTY